MDNRPLREKKKAVELSTTEIRKVENLSVDELLRLIADTAEPETEPEGDAEEVELGSSGESSRLMC